MKKLKRGIYFYKGRVGVTECNFLFRDYQNNKKILLYDISNFPLKKRETLIFEKIRNVFNPKKIIDWNKKEFEEWILK